MDWLPSGAPTGIGSLPFRDPQRAAAFTLRTCPELPSIPTLPKRSPAEAMIAQAVVGIPGVTVGQYGSLAVDLTKIDRHAPVQTPLDQGAFDGLLAFLEAADPTVVKRVKWQMVGPVTLGRTLVRAGVPVNLAFDVAVRAVRSHIAVIREQIDRALPGVRHVVFLDEPMLTDLQDPTFPVSPDVAIDFVSGTLAAIEQFGISGVHCCGQGDWASILAAGPGVLSLPVSADLVDVAGFIGRFLEGGGWIAWGAVHTDGPVPTSAQRPWRNLNSLWSGLARGGCDLDRLRLQALLTPACGLATHAEVVASRVFRIVRELSDRLAGLGGSNPATIGA
ncbi:MAG: hypothetical protein RL219_1705 [Actinomycetota bacterium]|jgi:hypothetical protein